MFELHAVRRGVKAEPGVAGDEHVAGRQDLRALSPHDNVVSCKKIYVCSFSTRLSRYYEQLIFDLDVIKRRLA